MSNMVCLLKGGDGGSHVQNGEGLWAKRGFDQSLAILPWHRSPWLRTASPCIAVRMCRMGGTKTAPAVAGAGRVGLAADAETLDQRAIAGLVVLLDVVKKRPAQRYELKQPAARVVVLDV